RSKRDWSSDVCSSDLKNVLRVKDFPHISCHSQHIQSFEKPVLYPLRCPLFHRYLGYSGTQITLPTQASTTTFLPLYIYSVSVCLASYSYFLIHRLLRSVIDNNSTLWLNRDCYFACFIDLGIRVKGRAIHLIGNQCHLFIA